MYEKQRDDISKYLTSLGYVWTKHPKYPEFYHCNDIGVIVSYKMIKFYIYDTQSKKVTDGLCGFSKNLDELLWKKFAKEILYYSITDAVDSMLDLMEKIEYDRK